MRVEQLMTREVVTVPPAAPLREAARLLAEHRVSGLPVVDDAGRVVGVVSEADVLARERQAGRERFDLLAWLAEWSEETERAKLRARTAGEAMTSPAITIAPTAPVSKAAAYLVDRGVNRLPVVDGEGRLVGIVSRSDFVRAFARDDETLERELRDDVLGRVLSLPPGVVQARVRDGEVTLTGTVETKELADLVELLAGQVLGVVAVETRIGWRLENGHWPAPRLFPGAA